MNNARLKKGLFYNVTVKNNSAGKSGGGIYLEEVENIEFHGLNLENNSVSIEKRL